MLLDNTKTGMSITLKLIITSYHLEQGIALPVLIELNKMLADNEN